MTQNQCFNTILLIIMIQVILSSGEYLSIHQIFKDTGLIPWRINRNVHPIFARFLQRYKIDSLLIHPNIIGLYILKILLAVFMLLGIYFNWPISIALLLLSLLNLLTVYRNYRSNNGADQMANIILVALTLGKILESGHSLIIALFFIMCQAALAYGTSGFLKLNKAGWHQGGYVIAILKTSTFGNRKLLLFFRRHKPLAIAASNAVVFGDILLCLAVLFPPPVCLTVLGLGVCLHLGIALVMGLNTFIWSFCATYPAIYYFSCMIYKS